MMNCWILVTHSHLKTRSVCLSVGDTDEGDGVRWRRRVWRAALTLSRRWLHADSCCRAVPQQRITVSSLGVLPRHLPPQPAIIVSDQHAGHHQCRSGQAPRHCGTVPWSGDPLSHPLFPVLFLRKWHSAPLSSAFFFSTSLVDHLLFCLILSAFLLICLDMPEWLYLSKVYRKVSSLKGLSCFFALFNWYLLMFNGLILSLPRIFLIILPFPVKSFFPFHLSTTPLTDSPFVAI